MRYKCDVCGLIVEGIDDMHEDSCPKCDKGLLYDALMLDQERSYHDDE